MMDPDAVQDLKRRLQSNGRGWLTRWRSWTGAPDMASGPHLDTAQVQTHNRRNRQQTLALAGGMALLLASASAASTSMVACTNGGAAPSRSAIAAVRPTKSGFCQSIQRSIAVMRGVYCWRNSVVQMPNLVNLMMGSEIPSAKQTLAARIVKLSKKRRPLWSIRRSIPRQWP